MSEQKSNKMYGGEQSAQSLIPYFAHLSVGMRPKARRDAVRCVVKELMWAWWSLLGVQNPAFIHKQLPLTIDESSNRISPLLPKASILHLKSSFRGKGWEHNPILQTSQRACSSLPCQSWGTSVRFVPLPALGITCEELYTALCAYIL